MNLSEFLFAALVWRKSRSCQSQKSFCLSLLMLEYRKTRDIVVEAVVGDPLKLKNQTLYQDAYPEYGINEGAYATIVDSEKINKRRVKLTINLA